MVRTSSICQVQDSSTSHRVQGQSLSISGTLQAGTFSSLSRSTAPWNPYSEKACRSSRSSVLGLVHTIAVQNDQSLHGASKKSSRGLTRQLLRHPRLQHPQHQLLRYRYQALLSLHRLQLQQPQACSAETIIHTLDSEEPRPRPCRSPRSFLHPSETLRLLPVEPAAAAAARRQCLSKAGRIGRPGSSMTMKDFADAQPVPISTLRAGV